MSEYDNLFGKPLRLFFYDIETAPMLAFIWSQKADWVNFNQIESEKFMLSWAGKWSDTDEVVSAAVTSKEARDQNDLRIVKSLAAQLRKADYAVAHNGDRFDLPTVNARLLLNQQDPLGSVQTIDTLKMARSSFNLTSNRLDYIAQTLGLGHKHSTSFELWRRCFYGEAAALKEMRAYNEQDVWLLEEVFHALKPYAKKLPRLVEGVEWRDDRCPSCGSTDRELAGHHRTAVNTFTKFRCLSCSREYKGWQAIGSKKMGATPL